MNFKKDNAWLLGQIAWRGMLPAQVTLGRRTVTVREPCLAVFARSCSLAEY